MAELIPTNRKSFAAAPVFENRSQLVGPVTLPSQVSSQHMQASSSRRSQRGTEFNNGGVCLESVSDFYALPCSEGIACLGRTSSDVRKLYLHAQVSAWSEQEQAEECGGFSGAARLAHCTITFFPQGETMHCPSCSSVVPDTSRYCLSCGKVLPSSEMETMAATSSPPAKSDSKPAFPSEAHSSGGLSRQGSISQSTGRFTAGTVFAERYRIIGLLGKGGMGEVYRADDLTLDQPVALKFLPDKVAADPERLERFYSEVRVARQVSHPNVCRIYDIGQMLGQHFISMEYVDGEDLASLLRRIGRLPQDKALEIARQICAGLAAAHERGVLHRDLKPANIMIDGQGKARLADFGLARAAEDVRDTNLIEGTPAYMAPEQFSGKAATIKSDLYSLGLVLYELFTGKAAFKSASVAELSRQHRESNPTNPSVLIPDMDPMVERVILRCLEKDPAARPASALSVSAALPGGDPLAAALAAGETPSPEMVAAAGDEGALNPAFAWAGLGYILLAMLGILLFAGRTSILNWVSLAKSPDALVDRSKDLIKKLGYDEAPRDTAYGFQETDFLGQLGRAADRLNQLKTGEPPGAVFWYRQGPEYLTNSSFYAAGVTKPNEPRLDRPGMLRVELDADGRLVSLDAVPAPTDTGAGASPDWSALFAEAGFDPAKFKSASPIVNPPVYADARAAWEGVYPRRSDMQIHIEAATLHGKPVYFHIFQPWNRPSHKEAGQSDARQKITLVFVLILLVGVLAATCLLAWRNLKLNRGDRRGAFRISFCLFVVEATARILEAHLVGDLNEMIGLLWLILSRALLFGALVWVGYLALEPHIRRLWPHTIISWSRLLVGNLRDPRIGRDILVGGIFGISLPLLEEFVYLAATRFGIATDPALASLSAINRALGLRYFVGALATHVTSAVSGAVYLFLFLFLLRLLLRKDWLAVPVFVIVMVADNSLGKTNPYLSVFYALIVFPSLIFLLRKFGLFAVMAFMIFGNLPSAFPITTDFSLWYSNIAALNLLSLAGLAIYAFRIALAGKPAFAFDLLKE